jgi:asparagine N-glycosylation enzyme membrane subunit Stt3
MTYSVLTLIKEQTYQWGFSFLQLNIAVILLLIWSVGTFIMWLRTSLIMHQRGRSEVAGEYKAVLELAAAMQYQFGKVQEDPLDFTEQELSQRIKARLSGGTIAYEVPITRDKSSSRKPFDWIRREKWWLAAAVVSCTLFSTGWMLNFTFFLFMLFFFCGIVYAMIVGRRDKFRIFIAFCWCILGAVMAVSIGATSKVPVGIKPYFLTGFGL